MFKNAFILYDKVKYHKTKKCHDVFLVIFQLCKVHLSKRLMSWSLSQAPLEFLFGGFLLSSFLSNELCSGSCEA